MLKDEMKVGDRNAEPHVEETLECYICGKDLDGKENEVKCESCPNSYHVACMNISREDKFSDITLVWICLCGNNNISVRMFDHLGIPIDVNQYECISPNQEVMEEPDGTPDECSTSRKIERGRFTKMKRYVNKGHKRSRSPKETNAKKGRNERYVDDCRNASTCDQSENVKNTVGKEKESGLRWDLIRSRKAKLLEKRKGMISVDNKYRHKDECSHVNKREKGVTYIGKAMKHLYRKSNSKIKVPSTENQSKMTQDNEKSKTSVSSTKKQIEVPEISENDLKVTRTGTVSHEETKVCEDGNDEHCLKSNEMAMLYSKQKSPSEWSSSDLDALVTCSIDMFSTSPDDVSASICKKGDGTSLGEPKTGPLTKYAHPDSLINTLEESLKNCDGCLMNFGKQTFLIMSHETGYYIFDAHSRSRKGCQSKQGKSILMHTKTWLGIYTYCIQLLNSMKLSCEETYKLTQVTVAHRSSTDALKHTIPTDTISQDKVDESLMVIQTEDRSVSKPESSQDKVHVTLNWKVQAKPTKPPDEIDVDLKSYRKVQAKPTKPTDEIAVDLKSYRKVQAEPTKSTDEIDVDLKSYRKVQAKPTKPTDEIDVDLKSYRVHAGGKNQKKGKARNKKEAVEVFRLITDTVLYLVLQVGKVCTSIA
ncbi:uncharacterized protein LOC105445600 isoform X3 [Strongylocentrotus purpuratus]|uniref:Zinc finger PHD-type domain-containing protein n=1 Tax=Strongylocentrotus purpuratus TaxID=7668 RepID=A0A7M7PTM2_STRPU|nr:uncharacterized protein LOC105445600 isoform X3 [Strongylocentrotus purpuratus]